MGYYLGKRKKLVRRVGRKGTREQNTVKAHAILEWKYIYETLHCVHKYIKKEHSRGLSFYFMKWEEKFYFKCFCFIFFQKPPINQINEWEKYQSIIKWKGNKDGEICNGILWKRERRLDQCLAMESFTRVFTQETRRLKHTLLLSSMWLILI